MSVDSDGTVNKQSVTDRETLNRPIYSRYVTGDGSGISIMMHEAGEILPGSNSAHFFRR
jgi:hypothetical protein